MRATSGQDAKVELRTGGVARGRGDGEAGGAIGEQSVELLGVRVTALTRSQLTALVANEVKGGRGGTVIAHHNLHSASLCRQDPALRRFYEQADYVHVDGMSLVAVARLLGLSLRSTHRTTYADWFPELLVFAQREQWRIFYLGSSQASLALGLRRVRTAFPRLQIEGAHGYFDRSGCSAENTERLAMIRDFQPDLLLVGMGMPRQELWIAHNLDQLTAKVILTSGACLDYVADTVPAPPRWAGQLGLEWLFRLLAEPRRLAYRYLFEPWLLVPILVRDLIQYRLGTRGCVPQSDGWTCTALPYRRLPR